MKPWEIYLRLKELVDALNRTSWSSWQTTGSFYKELTEANTLLRQIQDEFDDPRWVCLEGMTASEFAAYEYGCQGFLNALERVLSGEDKGIGVCNEPWEGLRRQVMDLKRKVASLEEDNKAAWVTNKAIDKERMQFRDELEALKVPEKLVGYVWRTPQGELKFSETTSWDCWTPVYSKERPDAH